MLRVFYFASLFIFSTYSMNISDFFPEINGNLTQITWAHAVNNNSFLDQQLNDSKIMMLEADVIIGNWHNNTNTSNITHNIPVMGHPPETESDLSLAEFLKKVVSYNTKPTNTKKKGIKLDFKSIQALSESVPVLMNSTYNASTTPLWINADILVGPGNSTATPVNSTGFFAHAKKFSDCTLSLGWTTNYTKQNTNASYTTEQIKEMIDVIQKNNVTQNITFAVRAGLTANSFTQIKQLKNTFNQSTITIWSSEGDEVNVENLRKVIFEYGVGKVFVDVPKELKDKLNLTEPTPSPAPSPAPGAAHDLQAGISLVITTLMVIFVVIF